MNILQNLVWNAHQAFQFIGQLLKYAITFLLAMMQPRAVLEPFKKVARSLRQHWKLIVNWFRAKRQYNGGIVEAMNANVKLRMRKAYGFRTFGAIEVALYHQFGCLPEPESTHRFW